MEESQIQPVSDKRTKMEKQRLQVDFTADAVKDIDELRRMTRLSSRAEVIRHALRFLQWALFEIRNNNATLLLERGGKLHGVVFPFTMTPTKMVEAEETEQEEFAPKGRDEFSVGEQEDLDEVRQREANQKARSAGA